MNFFQKIGQYFKDVKNELGKVNWPTRKQTINYTFIVVAISLITAAFLGLLDSVFTNAIIRRFF